MDNETMKGTNNMLTSSVDQGAIENFNTLSVKQMNTLIKVNALVESFHFDTSNQEASLAQWQKIQGTIEKRYGVILSAKLYSNGFVATIEAFMSLWKSNQPTWEHPRQPRQEITL